MTEVLPEDRFAMSRAVRARMHALIPGGAHTYAKGDDQYPEQFAPILCGGHGCRVEDVDGNRFVEFGMGLRAVTLGHGRREVVEAAARAAADGQNFARPALAELEAAELLADLVPMAEMVKFAKNSSDATSAAVRLARAFTGRDLVAICRDQPFFSVDDWFIGTTAMGAGIPDAVRDLTLSFPYADLEAVGQLFADHPGRIAALVLEPATWREPPPGYLRALVDLAHEHGALVVFDETITGFRWDLRGAQHLYGVAGDLAVFGKGMGNGYPIAALVGRADVMRLGGLEHDRERVFLLSYTHGAEHASLAAFREVVRIYRDEDVIGRLHAAGERLAAGVSAAAREAGVADNVRPIGRACNLVYQTLDADGRPSQPFRTLFLQETIRRGVIAPSLVVSAAHGDRDVDEAVEAIAEALVVYRRALEDGVERHLIGRPVAPVFRTWNRPRAD